MPKRQKEPEKRLSAAQLAQQVLEAEPEPEFDEDELREERPRLQLPKRVQRARANYTFVQREYGYVPCRCSIRDIVARRCTCAARRRNIEAAEVDPASDAGRPRELALLRGLEVQLKERDLRKYDRRALLASYGVQPAEMETAAPDTAQRFWWMIAALRVGICCHADVRRVSETLTDLGRRYCDMACDAFLRDPRTLFAAYSKDPDHAQAMRAQYVRRVRECRALPDERFMPYVAAAVGDAFVVAAEDRATFYCASGRNSYDIAAQSDVWFADFGPVHILLVDRAPDGSIRRWTAARDSGRLEMFRREAAAHAAQ